MAALTSTAFYSGVNPVLATVNTASGSDTLTYLAGSSQMLVLENATAGSLTPNIVGTAASATYPVPNTHTTVNLSTGLSVVVGIGVKKVINLDKISAYLAGSGVVTITGFTAGKITIYQ